MDLTSTLLFKYLQNHPIYKIFCSNDTLTKFISDNNRLLYKPNKISFIYVNDIYIELVPRYIHSIGFTNSIFMNVWQSVGCSYFRCYLMNKNSDPFDYSVRRSEFFYEYPSLSTKICYNKVITYNYNQETIIEILEKFQILHPEYRNIQFQNIIQKCVQTILCIKNILCNDIIYLIIQLLLKCLSHGEDFIYHISHVPS
jgi:hypothetical protein